jgi:RNA polymerase sigma factor (sigma-70 family)
MHPIDVAGENRQAAILSLTPMAERIARAIGRRIGASPDRFHELHADALLGCVIAIDSFDPACGAPLEAYAQLIIRRTVMAEVKKRRVQRVPVDATPIVIDDDRDEEMPSEPPVPLTSRDRGFRPRLVSLDRAENPEVPSLADTLESAGTDPAERVATEDLKEALEHAVIQLPESDRRVIEMQFYRSEARDTAAQLGVSHQRVSHIQKRAIKRLRTLLGPRIHPEDVD